MATKITDECIGCSACVDECPNMAIHHGPDGFMLEIDPDRCTECVGFHGREACAEACPVDCCITDADRIESEDVLFARAQALHPTLAERLVLTSKTSRFRS